MSPRNRTLGRGLPENLKVRKRYGRLYFAYKHPQTGKEHGMGSDRAKAIQAAKRLNSLLVGPDPLVTAVMGGAESLGAYIDRFLDELLPQHRSRKGHALAASTREDYVRMLRRVKGGHGRMELTDCNRRWVVSVLDEQSSNAASNHYRAALMLLFKYAVAEGRLEANPVHGTMAKPEEKARARLSLAGFQAVHEKAPGWLQNAMDLALHTLQRREDVALMRFSDVEGGALKVRQGKTGVCLRIRLEPALRTVIARCRDDLVSPFLVHREPERRIRAAWREHWTQVAPEMLSRGFKEARDDCGHFQVPMVARPTFHEIRSLGADLYRKAGIDPQALLGHTSARMTEHYLEGHTHWTDVSAGLEL